MRKALLLFVAILAMISVPASAQITQANILPAANYGDQLYLGATLLTGTWTCTAGGATCTTTGGAARAELDVNDWVAVYCGSLYYSITVAAEPAGDDAFTVGSAKEYITPASFPCVGAAYLINQGATAALATLYDGFGSATSLAVGTKGISVTQVTTTNGAKTVYVDLGVGNTAGGVTATGFYSDSDDDTSSNAATINNYTAVCSDVTGHASTVNQGFYTSGCDAGLQLDNGYLRVGTGSTPDVTPGDDDAFVEGTLEVDGAVRFDAAFTAGTSGAAAGAGNVAVERCVGSICQTTLTMTAVNVNILNTTGPGHNCFGGLKIYDFPAGWINRLGVVATFTHILAGAGGLGDDWDGDIGFGSTTAVEDGGLAATEVDWVPTTGLPQAAAGDVTTGIANSTVTEQTICDGHSAACDLFINFEADDADCSALDTLAVTGTVTVSWINIGDN